MFVPQCLAFFVYFCSSWFSSVFCFLCFLDCSVLIVLCNFCVDSFVQSQRIQWPLVEAAMPNRAQRAANKVLRETKNAAQAKARSPPRAARVEGVVFRLVVNSAMPCLWPLLCVSGNTSLLEPVPRRSVSQTANCTSRQALLCLVSRDRPRWSFLPSRPCAGGHPVSPLCTSLL